MFGFSFAPEHHSYRYAEDAVRTNMVHRNSYIHACPPGSRLELRPSFALACLLATYVSCVCEPGLALLGPLTDASVALLLSRAEGWVGLRQGGYRQPHSRRECCLQLQFTALASSTMLTRSRVYSLLCSFRAPTACSRYLWLTPVFAKSPRKNRRLATPAAFEQVPTAHSKRASCSRPAFHVRVSVPH